MNLLSCLKMPFFENAVFSMKINVKHLKKQPKIEITEYTLEAGTEMYFTIPGVGHTVYFRLINPLVFTFGTGGYEKIDTDIYCEVHKVKARNGSFLSIDEFKPFTTDSLHQVYDNISRIFKPNAKNHHAHIYNHFFVCSTGMALNEYRQSKNLFTK